MSKSDLDRIELVTGNETPERAVIWLHGLGADGHDFEAIVPELHLDDAPAIRFVFPHAPVRPVTINGGMEMRAWYDINPEEGLNSGDQDIRNSATAIEALIDEQLAQGVTSDRIVLAGFSQGGVIALHTGLRHRARLAGIMALSTYLHDHEQFVEECSFQNLDVPILYCHGLYDPMIPVTRAVTSREALTAANYAVQWHEYAMEHSVCQQEIDDIRRWLAQVLAL